MLPAKQGYVDINSGLARTLSLTALYVLLDSQMELQIMYAGTKLALKKEANLTRVYEVQELDELTEQWLQEKLCK
jgi:predicted peroxiredoxin